MAAKKCPRCGNALNLSGEKMTCPSCGVTLVRKSRATPPPGAVQAVPVAAPNPPPAVALIIPEQATAPAPARRAAPSLAPQLVLATAAVFLLLGTVLTGYAFALTLSTPAEVAKAPEPVVEPPKPPPPAPPPPEDWRVTLANLRQLVVTPPTTQ